MTPSTHPPIQSTSFTSQMLCSTGSAVTSKPRCRHISSMTVFSFRTSPEIVLRPSDFAYSMISCINAQPLSLEIGSEQDRVFAGLVDRIGVNPNHAHHLVGGFVERDKGHRAGIVELGQPGDELVGEFLHRCEEP